MNLRSFCVIVILCFFISLIAPVAAEQKTHTPPSLNPNFTGITLVDDSVTSYHHIPKFSWIHYSDYGGWEEVYIKTYQNADYNESEEVSYERFSYSDVNLPKNIEVPNGAIVSREFINTPYSVTKEQDPSDRFPWHFGLYGIDCNNFTTIVTYNNETILVATWDNFHVYNGEDYYGGSNYDDPIYNNFKFYLQSNTTPVALLPKYHHQPPLKPNFTGITLVDDSITSYHHIPKYSWIHYGAYGGVEEVYIKTYQNAGYNESEMVSYGGFSYPDLFLPKNIEIPSESMVSREFINTPYSATKEQDPDGSRFMGTIGSNSTAVVTYNNETILVVTANNVDNWPGHYADDVNDYDLAYNTPKFYQPPNASPIAASPNYYDGSPMIPNFTGITLVEDSTTPYHHIPKFSRVYYTGFYLDREEVEITTYQNAGYNESEKTSYTKFSYPDVNLTRNIEIPNGSMVLYDMRRDGWHYVITTENVTYNNEVILKVLYNNGNGYNRPNFYEQPNDGSLLSRLSETSIFSRIQNGLAKFWGLHLVVVNTPNRGNGL
jgi:hypothetical protein